ncbi:hypothetical protein L1887_05544 [Cichorium endivia]|nr:hypothetical protein L1887_05544 [Cichorium endivia]
MWRSRSKLSRNDSNKKGNSSPIVRRIPSNPDFNHQSLKDIENLFPHGSVSDLNAIPEEPSSTSPNCTTTTAAVTTDVKRGTIFHRVNLANRITKAFSARPKSDPKETLSESKNTVAAEKSENLEKSVKPEKSVKVEETVKPEKSVKVEETVKPEKSVKVEETVKSVKVEEIVKPDPPISIPGADKRVVVYMTSLRVVRSTFEACRTVRSILQGFRVPVDERDLSMDASFFDEIRKIMAQIGQGRSDDKRVDLPKVFIGGRYIGGADEVVELHEIGELKKFVKGLPAVTPGVCKFCGGFRFILCLECNGSHKCHTEGGVFTTCTVCNENGLIRCPSCLSS